MRIASSESQSVRRTGRTEPVILFYIADQMFAISANSIHEIRSTDSLSGAASEINQAELPKVRHRLRRGRKYYYVVNACAHFGLPESRPTLVLILRDSRVALLVDRIERMEAMSVLMALPHAFCGPERIWYRGITLIDDAVVPVVSPVGFLTRRELSLLDSNSMPDDSAQAESTQSADSVPENAHGAVSQ